MGENTTRTLWLWRPLLIAAMLSTNVGCTQLQGIRHQLAYNDAVNDFVLGWRNSAWAKQAWHRVRPEYADHPYENDFGKGFRAGYAAAASGGNGCPPAFPPREYWSWKYQTGEGQAKANAWFEGFPIGAKTAEEDGASYFQEIQTAHHIDIQYSPKFLHGEWPQKFMVDSSNVRRDRRRRPEPLPPPTRRDRPRKTEGEDVPAPDDAPSAPNGEDSSQPFIPGGENSDAEAPAPGDQGRIRHGGQFSPFIVPGPAAMTRQAHFPQTGTRQGVAYPQGVVYPQTAGAAHPIRRTGFYTPSPSGHATRLPPAKPGFSPQPVYLPAPQPAARAARFAPTTRRQPPPSGFYPYQR